MNILITGGAGYIGSNVAYNLIGKGHKTFIIDNLSTGNKRIIPKKAKFVKSDISNKQKLKKILKFNKFDAVMHFSGFIRVDESIKKPKKYYLNNYKKSKIFLKMCIENGIKNFIFSSTAAVYGNKKKNVTETDYLDPKHPYAKSKIKVENFLKICEKKNDIKYVVLRYFNVAGADKFMRTGHVSKASPHLIKKVCETILGKRKNIVVYGNDYKTPDGSAIRDYIHVSDLAEIHRLSLMYLKNKKTSQIFNCGYGKGVSVLEVLKNAKKIYPKKINWLIGKRRKKDIYKSVADNKKIRKILKFKPKFNNLSLIIKSSLRWEKKFKKFN
tara:strand:- start:609 stop:1589 length:981 start_codon:yes stop_codon:yes gene_type:complete